MRYSYDLHVHSCLSPCADDDNTPNNIAGMAALSGINILALTDHNSTKNCPAFFTAAERYGIVPVAGMELTTSEDIHIVCLFPELDSAMRFGEYVDAHRAPIKNRPSIFGNQLILDGEDNVIGTEESLLSFATDISSVDLPDIVKEYSGICYPAHIDREANGIIAILGTFPVDTHFDCFEVRDKERIADLTEKHALSGKVHVISSDAHCLTDIRDAEFYFELDCEDDSPEQIRRALFKKLGKETDL